MVVTRTLAIPLTSTTQLCNANTRAHWSKEHKKKRHWRTTAHTICRSAINNKKIKKLTRAHITITISFPDNRRRDINNYQPTSKAIIDGLIDAGLLPDDSDRYLTGPDMRRGKGTLGITVTIEEL